jgi:hypothetical protein
MNTDVEQLVREGLDRLVARTEVPAGLADRAHRHLRRRRLAAGSAIAAGTTLVTAIAVVAATGATGPAGPTRAQLDAFAVLRQVQSALAQQDLVMRGDTISASNPPSGSQRSVTWSYRNQDRYLEFFHGKPYLADGTAEIGGKLAAAYVTYFDRKWSGGSPPYAGPSNACGKNGVMMGGPAPSAADWPAFIKATLACGSAAVTGHAEINGVDTIKIAGSPLTVGLPKGMVKATKARVWYTLYVDPSSYLPVRMSGTTLTYGHHAGSFAFTSVTDIRWLPPTPANIAQTLVTIPPGFQQVSSPADQ